ncbi:MULTISPECIES: potassium transporter Kup [Rhodomicrobium]|uniref:potassium transporter Kup n=1 Tax=Rhodomicrobium TaxID=1068 RepID=UPI000B4AE88C|nr:MULTISPECIES: potassium transporter Kup [Rhodomicrobium]
MITPIAATAETPANSKPGVIPVPVPASMAALVVGSIGVVYGDIGTSPLYAFREAVTAAQHSGLHGREAVLGVLSLILWALLLVVTGKYVLLLLRADNKGEGGTFALMALVQSSAGRYSPLILVLGLVGASFFYGDSVITPAISVLSAVEGLKLLQPSLEVAVLPISIIILIGLFAVQPYGTAKVAALFGPIMLCWFAMLAIGGLIHIADNFDVFNAINPLYGIRFLATNGLNGIWVLGFVFLAVTGAEALYADLGHFGRKPIQTAWLSLVLPALALNYFGQGALVLSDPAAVKDSFYHLYPSWALFPVLLLATMATVIASQAVITGTFSLTRQAIQLGLLPRVNILHTSATMAGQIYIPRVNIMLMVAVILVTLMFRTSSNLAAAYGVAVTADMIISSVLAFFLLWRVWKWTLWRAAMLMVPIVIMEQVFFAANAVKLFEGAWLPLVMATAIATVMAVWIRGSRALTKATQRSEIDLCWLVRKLEASPPHRVPGTAIFLTSTANLAPTSLMHNLKHNRVLHERNVILTIVTKDVPRVPRKERVEVSKIDDTFTRVTASYGFMETPNVPKILMHCKQRGLGIEANEASFFLSRRSLRLGKNGLPRWQKRLFIWLASSAEDATSYFQIPRDRVIEIGTQVAI